MGKGIFKGGVFGGEGESFKKNLEVGKFRFLFRGYFFVGMGI